MWRLSTRHKCVGLAAFLGNQVTTIKTLWLPMNVAPSAHLQIDHDWQGQSYCQGLTQNINNVPNILEKMNKLCPEDAPCQSNADLVGTWPDGRYPTELSMCCVSKLVPELRCTEWIYEQTNSRPRQFFVWNAREVRHAYTRKTHSRPCEECM